MSMADIARTPLSICPNCQHPLDAAGTMDGSAAKPEKDDLTICLHCAAVLQFNADLTLRQPTPEEVIEFPAETRYDLAQGIKAVKKANAIREETLQKVREPIKAVLDIMPEHIRADFLASFLGKKPPPYAEQAMKRSGIKPEDIHAVVLQMYRERGWPT